MRAANSAWSSGATTERLLAQVRFSTGRGIVSSTREKRWAPIFAPITAMCGSVRGVVGAKAAKKAFLSNCVPLYLP